MIITLLMISLGVFIPSASAYSFHDLYASLANDNKCIKCDLSDAYLVNAKLSGANLINANLNGADLSGAVFCNTIMPDGTINDSGC